MAAAKIPRNPYIIGGPIDNHTLIFGRETLFNFIEDNLNLGVQVIFLSGQRRIGKSSVLKQIPHFVAQGKFVFVSFDMKQKSQSSLGELLHYIGKEIVDYLELDYKRVKLPSVKELETEPNIFSLNLLPKIDQELGDRYLVWLLDEFDVWSEEKADTLPQGWCFYSYLQSLIQKHEKLFLIPVVGRKPGDMPKLDGLFNHAAFKEIGLLDEPSTKELITVPAQGVLEYYPDAIQAIWELSLGDPYFTQIICFALFGRARERHNWKVICEDVEGIVDKAIELAEGGLAGCWAGLSIPERVVFSAVAEAQRIAILENQRLPKDPSTLLKSYGVIQTEQLVQAGKRLATEGLLDDTGHRVKVELVRRWLVQHHSLRQERWQLERLEQEEVNPLLLVAAKLHQQGRKQNALTFYEQILKINPNHFSSIVALADGYLEVEDFDKAVELYTRAYKVDPISNKEGLLRALVALADGYLEVEDFDKAVELYTRAYKVDPISNKEGLLRALQAFGQKLITQREFTRANELFNLVLEIEPDNLAVKEKLGKDYGWFESRGRRRNPYIIGRPIVERELFFGRESLFGFIEDNLQQNVKVILLHGQRRIGKSSVLKQIPQLFAQFPQNEFVFVNFDLQDKAALSLSQILHLLATEILTHLVDYLDPIAYDRVSLPHSADLETDPDIFYGNFLRQVYQELGDKKLVLLLDEFDLLSGDRTQSAEEHFFPYLKRLIEQHEKLFIIPVVGRNLGDLPKLLSLFGRAPYQEIGLLDELSGQRLITKPAQGILEYKQDAIQAILELSAGHPYFTQIICNALFGQARADNNSQLTRVDVEGIVDRAIENAEGGLDWFWQGLPTPEQVVFSAVAKAQTIAISKAERVPEEPLTLLRSYGVTLTDSLIQANERLASNDRGFLDDTGRRVKVELVRRWLVERHPLRQEIWQLENLEQQEVNQLWEQATQFHQQGRKRNALARYEQILEINPNHFSTVAALAEGYLEVEEFDKAVELYTRAYQVDQIRHKEGLLRALQKSGQKLMNQREFTGADAQFNRILEIEPDNRAAQEKLLEINQELGGRLAGTGQISNTITRVRPWRIPLGGIAATLGIIALIGVGGVYRWITPCSAGQQKVFGIGCVADLSRISRGERTLFPRINNSDRDKGIEAFKQGNYSQAAELFKKSVAVNRNDPELLIYYNNARARQQQGSPLTLATVVPVNNEESTAKEMLRGVAQAQHQFNEKGGFNGRLLEIAIANDGNEPNNARQVAQELVKDSSVLGVIGHNSSDATKAALGKYEKAGLPIISPTSTSPFLTSDVFFRTVPSNAASGKKLAEYAKNSLGLNKVVIFYNPDSAYSNSMREEFTKNFESIGGQVILGDLTDSRLDADKQVAKSLFRHQAQAVVLFPDIKKQDTSTALKIATAKADLMARSSNARKRGLKLLGGNTLYSNTTLQEGGKAVEGLILAVPWFREAPQSKNFAQAAAKQWGGSISWRTATSYDATQAFIKALDSPNPSGSTVLQKLRQTKLSSSETSGESLEFKNGERQSKPILVKVVNSQFIILKE
ncbi:MAG: ABC transporter substrate-binding protein [Tolypothrix carrinoi HA7290-LM1]|jgi:ABC-type branched-subunit amino acid transport system substrate-binding protein/Tfp pilus assembly protein PilF|nr:ABC transporter substrate-binding protein [Tolypothrix carrinoi HA7290-LM1]